MAHQDVTRVGLLQQRLSLVANLSALNAEALRLTQGRAGLLMEIQHFELETVKNGTTEELARELLGLEASAESIRIMQIECSESIAAIEKDVAVVDRLLAANQIAGEH